MDFQVIEQEAELLFSVRWKIVYHQGGFERLVFRNKHSLTLEVYVCRWKMISALGDLFHCQPLPVSEIDEQFVQI